MLEQEETHLIESLLSNKIDQKSGEDLKLDFDFNKNANIDLK